MKKVILTIIFSVCVLFYGLSQEPDVSATLEVPPFPKEEGLPLPAPAGFEVEEPAEEGESSKKSTPAEEDDSTIKSTPAQEDKKNEESSSPEEEGRQISVPISLPRMKLLFFNKGKSTVLLLPDKTELHEKDLSIEMIIPVGSTLVTGPGGAAELLLMPAETRIRLGELSVFRIDALAGVEGNSLNLFYMESGKFRLIPGAVSQKRDFAYEVQGPTSACYAREGDFGMIIGPVFNREEFFVLAGEADFARGSHSQKFKLIHLMEGQMASAFVEPFAPVEIPEYKMRLITAELQFLTE